jgi:hypothetical protein
MKSQTLTNAELSKAIRNNMFGKRDTLEEAFEYAVSTMQGNPAAITGMMVVLNTVADKIELAAVLNELGIK